MLTFLAACCTDPVGPVSTQAARVPNFLLILADDLGYGDLGVYGSPTIRTPHLDRLASAGMRFTSFYTNGPICSPTRVSILTGRYPQRYGLYGGLTVDSTWGLPADVATLPRLLRDAGYATRHIGKWHVGHAEASFRPPAQGFDDFFGFWHAHHLRKTYRDPKLRRGEAAEAVHPGHLTELLTEAAASFLRQRSEVEAPFFLNLWLFSPHKPIQPPQRWVERYDDTAAGRYAALVSHLDENVGQLLGVLDETGLADDTVVIFLSDNGGARDLHGGRNGPLQGGKNQLLEGGIRVPLIVRWPGRVAAGSLSDALVASFDLLPTIAELAEVDTAGLALDGRSLATVLSGAADDFEGPLFWDDLQGGRRRFAVRLGPWKLRSAKGIATLHDLRIDPGESRDLAAVHSETAAELEAAYRAWRAQLPPAP